MFGLFLKNYEIKAPVDGKVIDIEKVTDQVFADKIVGDGIAIDSIGDTIVSPADGIVKLIFKTNHAFGLVLKNGEELLVHIGIDTVELKGEGFTRLVEEGTDVKAGDPIIKLDRQFILSKGYSLVIPVIITNMEMIYKINKKSNKEVKAGELVFTYKVKEDCKND